MEEKSDSVGWYYAPPEPPRYGVWIGGVFTERVPDGYRVDFDEKTGFVRLVENERPAE